MYGRVVYWMLLVVSGQHWVFDGSKTGAGVPAHLPHMTTQPRKGQTGETTTNNGEFGSKRQDEPTVASLRVGSLEGSTAADMLRFAGETTTVGSDGVEITFRNEFGSSKWWEDPEGREHNPDGPAFVYSYNHGSGVGERYYRHGVPHRDGDLPAETLPGGMTMYWVNGQLHRDGDKPAVVHPDGMKQYFRNGDLHRDGGEPAVVYPDGRKWWYEHGKFVRAEENDGTPTGEYGPLEDERRPGPSGGTF